MNQITQLPEDYFSINEGCVVHRWTIERFSKDVAAFLDYLNSAKYHPSADPESMKEITIRSNAPPCDVAMRMREHGELMRTVAQFLADGRWPDDQRQPLFLRGGNTDLPQSILPIRGYGY